MFVKGKVKPKEFNSIFSWSGRPEQWRMHKRVVTGDVNPNNCLTHWFEKRNSKLKHENWKRCQIYKWIIPEDAYKCIFVCMWEIWTYIAKKITPFKKKKEKINQSIFQMLVWTSEFCTASSLLWRKIGNVFYSTRLIFLKFWNVSDVFIWEKKILTRTHFNP